MKSTILSLLFVFSALLSFAQTDAQYTNVLGQYFKATGASQTFEVVIEQMIELQKSQYPEVSKEFWDETEQEFKKTSMKDLAEMLTPVYQKYLTVDELKEAIEFYDSPTGKKIADATPSITQESMAVGEVWGYQVAQKIIEKMED